MRVSNLSKAYRILFLFFIVGSMGLFYSCKKTSEKLTEKMIEKSLDDESDVNIGKEKISIETQDGSFTMDAKANSWPKEIPDDVPKFVEGKVLSVSKMQFPHGENWTILYENILASEADEYKEKLEANGFTIQATINMGQGTHIIAEKENLMVRVMAGEGNVAITVTMEK